MPVMARLEDRDRTRFERIAMTDTVPTFASLYEALGDEYFGFDRFAYLGPCSERALSSEHVVTHLTDWVGRLVLPEVMKRNQTRMLRAFPNAPKFDPAAVLDALWVLESEQGMVQGTAFSLTGVGIVTCDHVLRADTKGLLGNKLSIKLHGDGFRSSSRRGTCPAAAVRPRVRRRRSWSRLDRCRNRVRHGL